MTSSPPHDERAPAAFARIPVRAVVVLYSYRAVAAVLVGYPAARTLGAFGATSLPDGDLAFFGRQGTWLLEAGRLGARALTAALESAALATVVLATVALLPLALVLADLAAPHRTRASLVAAATGAAPSLLLLGAAATLLQGLLAVGTAGAVRTLSHLTDTLANEQVADLILVALGVVGVLAVVVGGFGHDLARAAIVGGGHRSASAMSVAWTRLRASPRAVAVRLGGPLVLSGAVMATAAALTSLIDVSRPGMLRVAAVCAVHQLSILMIVVLRLRALGAALSIAGGARPTRE